MGFPISTNLFRSISDSGENLTRGAEILNKEHFFFVLFFLTMPFMIMSQGIGTYILSLVADL